MKTCTKCGETKTFTEFHKHKRNKDGYRYHCKVCRQETARRYREENKEAVRERERRYRQKNKEAIAERARRRYQENKETINEYQRQRYQENKETINEYQRQYQRQYYQENKEAIIENNRRYYRENKEARMIYGRWYNKKRAAEQPGCVYQIVNSINGKMYVGETIKGELRWMQHLGALRGNRHANPILQADFNEFGEDVFEWSVIQEFPKDKEVLEREETNTIERLLAEGKELYNVHKN